MKISKKKYYKGGKNIDIQRPDMNLGMDYNVFFHTKPISEVVVLNDTHFMTFARGDKVILNEVKDGKLYHKQHIFDLKYNYSYRLDKYYNTLKIETNNYQSPSSSDSFYFKDGLFKKNYHYPAEELMKAERFYRSFCLFTENNFMFTEDFKKFFLETYDVTKTQIEPEYYSSTRSYNFKTAKVQMVAEFDSTEDQIQIVALKNEKFACIYNFSKSYIDIVDTLKPFNKVHQFKIKDGVKNILSTDYDDNTKKLVYISGNNQKELTIVDKSNNTFSIKKQNNIAKVNFAHNGRSLFYAIHNMEGWGNKTFLTSLDNDKNLLTCSLPEFSIILNDSQFLGIVSGDVIFFEIDSENLRYKTLDRISSIPKIYRLNNFYLAYISSSNKYCLTKDLEPNDKDINPNWQILANGLPKLEYDISPLVSENGKLLFLHFLNSTEGVKFKLNAVDSMKLEKYEFPNLRFPTPSSPIKYFLDKNYLYISNLPYFYGPERFTYVGTYILDLKKNELKKIDYLNNLEILGKCIQRNSIVCKDHNNANNSFILYNSELSTSLQKIYSKFASQETNKYETKIQNDTILITHYEEFDWPEGEYIQDHITILKYVEVIDLISDKKFVIPIPPKFYCENVNFKQSGNVSISQDRCKVFIPGYKDEINCFLIYNLKSEDFTKYKIQSSDLIDFSDVIFEREDILKIYANNKILKVRLDEPNNQNNKSVLYKNSLYKEVLIKENKTSILGIQFIVYPGYLVMIPNTNKFPAYFHTNRYDLIQVSRIDNYGKSVILNNKDKTQILAAFNNEEIIKAGFINYNPDELQRLLSQKEKKHKEKGFNAINYRINILDTTIRNKLALPGKVN